MRSYRFLDIITALFVTVLLVSNIASTKFLDFFALPLDGGTILFPLSYIFGDVLTEVYGYQRARRVIWIGFICLAVMTATFAVVNWLPAAPEGLAQAAAFSTILGLVPRIALGSLLGYWTGEFVNSYLLAQLKLKTQGKHLWVRTISSTLLGQIVDTSVFLLVAFAGAFPTDFLWQLFLANYIFKVGVEVLFTPLTYQIVNWLKRQEKEDFYDWQTDFNPLRLQ